MHSRRSSSFAESGCVWLLSIHCRLDVIRMTMILAVDDGSEDVKDRIRVWTVKERLGRLGDRDHMDQVLKLDG